MGGGTVPAAFVSNHSFYSITIKRVNFEHKFLSHRLFNIQVFLNYCLCCKFAMQFKDIITDKRYSLKKKKVKRKES